MRNRKCTVFDIALGSYPQDTIYITTDIIICTSLHQSKISLRPLSQATSSTELPRGEERGETDVPTTFSNFLKRASTVLLLQWTFYQIRKAAISRRYNQLFRRCFCPFFHRHSSILTPQHRNRHAIFVTSFSSERRIELTHVIFRLQRVDQN